MFKADFQSKSSDTALPIEKVASPWKLRCDKMADASPRRATPTRAIIAGTVLRNSNNNAIWQKITIAGGWGRDVLCNYRNRDMAGMVIWLHPQPPLESAQNA